MGTYDIKKIIPKNHKLEMFSKNIDSSSIKNLYVINIKFPMVSGNNKYIEWPNLTSTNVFRDVNIAFVNELSILFERLGVDIFTVLEAAKTKYNFQIHYPGAGVGGPCLPVNSYQMINSSSSFKNSLELIKTARKINENMPKHVIELLKEGLNEKNVEIENSSIAILGISYKPNVKDVQITPAEKIINQLKESNCKIKIYDPYFESVNIFSCKTESKIIDAIKDTDAVIIVTNHKEFYTLDLELFSKLMKKPLIIDSRGIFNPKEMKKHNIIFRGIGRNCLK